MLRIVLGSLATIAAAIALIALWGSRLPVAHVATRSVTLPAATEEVFAVLADVAKAPAWRSKLTRVELDPTGPGGRTRFTEVSGGDRLTMEIEESRPPERMVTRIVGAGAFGGAWAYRIEPMAGGSRVTITEHGEVYNPIFRLISAKVMGHTATLDQYLGDLARRFDGKSPIEDAAPVPLRP